MDHTTKKKILIFGAGRIGRSFIAQLFYNAGFTLVFVDIDENLVNLLNAKKSYRIVIRDKKDKIIKIKDLKAIHAKATGEIEKELLDADICSVSVGPNGFEKVADLIAKGIKSRYKEKPASPLDFILAENLRNAAMKMQQALASRLPEQFPLDEYVGLIETSIGKMVPLMTSDDLKDDPLQVFAESYNTLILDKKGFRNKIPDVEGLEPRENMKAWVDRKLFIHNLGHAALAYLGFIKNPEWKYTWEALEDNDLKNSVIRAMQESVYILMHMYPDEFTQSELTEHIHDLINRFSNKKLKDTIFRVGCETGRKLGPEDRLVPVVKYANKHQLPCKNIMKVLISGIYFDARDEKDEMHEADHEFLRKFNRNISRIMVDHCKFDPEEDEDLIFLGMNINDRIKETLKK